MRFCGDEEDEDGGDEERQEEEEEEEEKGEGKGEGKNWGLEPQRRNQDRREGGTFMESFWRVGDEHVCGVEARSGNLKHKERKGLMCIGRVHERGGKLTSQIY